MFPVFMSTVVMNTSLRNVGLSRGTDRMFSF